ncbi:MAG TPA: ABC transporter ATP-binding protein [Candidatus Limnocylindrales bacterium]
MIGRLTRTVDRISTTATEERAFLTVNNLKVAFPTEDGLVQAVDDVSFSIEKGKTLAIVGESGSGKSVTAQALMGLLDRKSAKVSGEIWLNNVELLGLSTSQLQSMRGDELAMIFQDPMSSLHPFYRVGDQIVEAMRAHRKVNPKEARREVIDMFKRVGIPAAERRVDAYPHQLSGGMRQRVMIAMALINGPDLLIADEPTTALDVTVQAQILELIQDLQKEFGTTVIVITHDLGIVADMADEVAVMYGARIVEKGPTHTIFNEPEMPYTLGLLASIPRMDMEAGGRLLPIPGNPPSPLRLPKGCVFEPRCRYASMNNGLSETVRPDLLPSGSPDHLVRCHLPQETRRRIAEEVLTTLRSGTKQQ